MSLIIIAQLLFSSFNSASKHIFSKFMIVSDFFQLYTLWLQTFAVENFHNFHNYTVTLKVLFMKILYTRHKVSSASDARVAQVFQATISVHLLLRIYIYIYTHIFT